MLYFIHGDNIDIKLDVNVVVDKLIIVNRSLYISWQEIVAGFADRGSVLVDTQCNLIHADGWREAKGRPIY